MNFNDLTSAALNLINAQDEPIQLSAKFNPNQKGSHDMPLLWVDQSKQLSIESPPVSYNNSGELIHWSGGLYSQTEHGEAWAKSATPMFIMLKQMMGKPFLWPTIQPAIIEPAEVEIDTSNLRAPQVNALRALNENISFVWGPAGTGKTYTSSFIVEQLRQRKKKVLVTANACQAVSCLYEKYVELFPSQGNLPMQFFSERVAIDSSSLFEKYRAYDTLDKELRALEGDGDTPARRKLLLKMSRITESTQVAFCNLARFAVTFNSQHKLGVFDYILIDESSQIPMLHLAYLATVMPEAKFIIVGDPKQLQPVIQTKTKSPWYGTIYDWCGINDTRHTSLSLTDKSKAHNVSFLSQSSRMPAVVTNAVSSVSYQSELQSTRKAEDFEPQLNIESNLTTALAYVESRHILDACDKLNLSLPKNVKGYQEDIAEAVLCLHLAVNAKGSCMVISPYNMQVKLINYISKLKNLGVTALTVHKAQGAEADLVIFSPTSRRSYHNSGDKGKLLFNVAVTRAKQQFIIVGMDDKCESAIEVIQNLQLPPPKPKEVEAKPQEKETKMNYIGAYAGIGARNTPQEVLDYMSDQARILQDKGLILRTGDADGADKAFRDATEHKLVYTPNQQIEQWARDEVSFVCDTQYDEMKPHTQNLLARNMYQLFGSGARKDARQPSMFVLYWSLPSSQWGTGFHNSNCYNCSGGTRYAVRAACNAGIPTFNLYNQRQHWESYRDSGFDPLNALSVVDERKEVEEPENVPEVDVQVNPPVAKPVKKANPWGVPDEIIEVLKAELK